MVADRRRDPPEDDWRIEPLAHLLSGVIRALAALVEIRHHDESQIRGMEASGEPFILAFWHRHLVLMRYAYRGRRMHVLVSRSWDGELTARTLEHLGIGTVRGSSSQGGAVALREIVRKARQRSDLAFTPDGPRGPLRVVQPGVVVAAAMTGLPVIPVAIAASHATLLRSWDRMVVPRPGSRVEIVYGAALRFARDTPVEHGVDRLGVALHALEERADELARGTS